MSQIAAALKHMLSAGMTHDAIIAAVAEMEAAAPVRNRISILDSRPRTPVPVDLRNLVMGDGRCAYCGSKNGPFEVDHIHPWSRGGTHDKANLALACKPCNRRKGAKTLTEWGAL